MIMKLLLIIKVIILEEEKEKYKLGKWTSSLRKCHMQMYVCMYVNLYLNTGNHQLSLS